MKERRVPLGPPRHRAPPPACPYRVRPRQGVRVLGARCHVPVPRTPCSGPGPTSIPRGHASSRGAEARPRAMKLPPHSHEACPRGGVTSSRGARLLPVGTRLAPAPARLAPIGTCFAPASMADAPAPTWAAPTGAKLSPGRASLMTTGARFTPVPVRLTRASVRGRGTWTGGAAVADRRPAQPRLWATRRRGATLSPP